MARRFAFKGMMAPNFTPYKADGSLNLKVIPTYAKHLKENGVKGVWVSGNSGEGMSMTLEERKAVTEAWLGYRNDVPTAIIQCAAGCLKDTQELARHAASQGAGGVAVLPCLYDKPATTDDLVDYMVEVAKVCPDTPLFYYHIPFKTGVTLSMSEFLEKGVKRIPTLAGIKFTDHDVSGEGKKCLQVDGGSLAIFTGYDETLHEALSLGFTCAVNASFNFLPHLTSRIFSLMEAGQKAEAKTIQEHVNNVFNVVSKQHSGQIPVSSLKTACTLLTGIDMGPTRFPVRPFTPAMTSTLRNDLKELGLTVY